MSPSDISANHESRQHQSTDRAFTILASAAVISAVVAGFWLLGSPNRQRLISLDADRVNHLMQIAGAISIEYGGVTEETAQPPPDSLEDISVRPSALVDPVTAEPYEYRSLTDSTYELCATFATSSLEAAEQNRRFSDERWAHPDGRHCYEFDVSNRDPNPEP